ncbi:hypothetical protein [Kitasatospora sp. NPDC088548]|uniref:hypothetical protein n=1 Tax=Kitasatospora sp. NPDC088548 TaxID=3364075 RepID=UPI0037F113FF
MATHDLTAATPSDAPSMAASGYGKKSAPGQRPRRADDFAHLPGREAYLASLIDRLPEGAAMDTKTLARDQPHYGQQAVRTALNNLSVAGHLRRIRERVGADRTQWVFRTYFSRTARDDAWWAHFLATGDPAEVHPDERPGPRAPRLPPHRPPHRPPRSPAYDALAALGLADARLALSATECADLEPLAAQWLARGMPPDLFAATLTAGLPPSVHSPAAFTRRRLLDKMPPERPWAPAPPPSTRIIDCTDCRTPSRPQALLGGLCRACRTGAATSPPPPARLSPAAVHTHATHVRNAVLARRAARQTGRDSSPRTRQATPNAPAPQAR